MSAQDGVRHALRDAILAFPNLRVGQIIWNATNGVEIFYMSDEDLARLIRQYTQESK